MSAVSEVSEADWAVWRAYNSGARQLARALDRRLQADAGISHPEYTVLLAVFQASDGRLRAGELAEIVAWEKSRVSHQVSRMEARGFVSRHLCATDARGTWIELTAEGRRVLLRAMKDHAVAIRELFLDQMDDAEKTAVQAASRRMIDALNPVACELVQEFETA